jgi:hypothetical protein
MSGAPGIRVGNIFILAGRAAHSDPDAGGLSGQLEAESRSFRDDRLLDGGERSLRDPRLHEKAHAGCQIGSYPFFREGKVGANFVIRSTDEQILEACANQLIERLESGGRSVVRDGI